MLKLLRDSTDKTSISLDRNFCWDLNWFNTFWFSTIVLPFVIIKLYMQLYFGCLFAGFRGGTFDKMIYALSLPLGFNNYTFIYLEILNLVVALKIWGSYWKDKTVEIKCDNMAVVEVLRSGRACDSTLAMCARNMSLLSAIFNVELVVNHISGCHNVAVDLLSRWQGTMADFNKLQNIMPDHTWIPVHIDLTKLNEHI